jgi:hypothetical protein
VVGKTAEGPVEKLLYELRIVNFLVLREGEQGELPGEEEGVGNSEIATAARVSVEGEEKD